VTARAEELVKEVEGQAREVYEQVLDPIASRFEFEGAPPASETTGLPSVLFLGNHSSGKSSFINHLVGEEVQRTGIAPIDDGFTLITHGDDPDTRDGNSVVTNPKLPWSDLKRFGPQLVNHLRMVLRASPSLEGIVLIDSPGMIDSADSEIDRGYDFAAVVRWFAERADVILLLFDPDKPGTTGETLQVLTRSLNGLEHKLLLVFNKVDRFDSMRDYARAYGALCWNLSKAIPRKDLPHIYNTYLPVPDARTEDQAVPLGDFDRQRDEVRAEVLRAPYRRVDNVISRLYQHARRLRVHVRVLDRLAWERLRLALRYVAMALLAALGLAGALWLGWAFSPDEHRWTVITVTILVGVVILGGIYGLYWWDRRKAQELTLDSAFERAFARELTLGDEAEDLRALWKSVRERLRRAIAARGKLPRARRSDLRRLRDVIDERIPALRASASEGKKKAAAAGEPLAEEPGAGGGKRPPERERTRS